MKNLLNKYPNLNTNFLPYFCLYLIIFLVVGRSIGFGFSHDDILVIDDITPWKFSYHTNYWRPFWNLWLLFADHFFNLNPLPFHLVNFFLHLSNGCMAFLLLTKLGLRKLLAFIVITTWSLLAGNVYAIVWISEATDLFAMFFLLIASLAWVKSCRMEKASVGWIIFASSSWVMSVLSKEMGLLWPIGAFLFAYFTQNANNRKLSSFIRSRPTSIIPLLFFALLISLRLLIQGPTAGMDPTIYPGAITQFIELPWYLVLLGRFLHYTEGLFYAYLPLDLFYSKTGILLGITLSLCLAVSLIVRKKQESQSNYITFKIFLGWLLLFTAHATMVPHPRTLYIPTLGLSGILCLFLYSYSKKKYFLLRIILFCAYLSMHVYMGQSIMDYFSPTSIDTKIGMAQILKTHTFTHNRQAKEAFIKKELGDYYNVDLLAKQSSFYDGVIWRQFVKIQFKKLCDPLTIR